MRVETRVNLLYQLLMAVFYTMFCFCAAFMSRFLQENGFSYTQIATATMISSVTGFFIQPLWGNLNDRGVSPKIIVIGAGIISLTAYFFFTYLGETYIISIGALIFAAAGISAAAPIVDAWGVKLIAQGGNISYPKARSFGSLTYAITSVLFGMLLDAMGMRVTPWLMLITLVPLVIIVLMLPVPRSLEKHAAKPGFAESLKVLMKHPTFKHFVFALFLSGIGTAAQVLYFPMLMSEMGGTNIHIGTGIAVMAFSEVLVMPFYGRLKARFGIRNLFTVSLIGTGIRVLAVALSVNPVMCISVMVFQSIAGALQFPSIAAYISDNIDSRYISMSQVLFGVIGFTLSGVVSNLVSGPVATVLGIRNTLLITCTLPFIAGVYLIIITRKSNIKEGIIQ